MTSSQSRVHRSNRRLSLIALVALVAASFWPSPAGAELAASPFPSMQASLFVFDDSTTACDEAAYTATRYVDVNHPSASDSNPGTESQPWRTFVHAGVAAVSGDRVLVKAGVYDHGDIEIEQGGTCFTAYPGQERQAIVRGAGLASHGNSDLVVNGFKFEQSPEHSVRIVGPNAENIVVSNNHTYDTTKSGISIRGVTGNADPGNYDNMRNVLVTGNLIELANHGDGGEIISVGSGVINADIAYNELRIGDPVFGDGDEGISFKEGVRDSRIFGNVIHNLSDKAISIDGGSTVYDPLVSNIEIFDNVFYDLPANGMWVTTEGKGDVDGVYIHDNIVYGVEGNGILVYEHPAGAAAGGTVRNVLIEHNTVWNNGRHSGYGGIRVDHPSAPGIVIRDNLAWGNNGYDIEGDNGTTIDSHNLCRETALCQVTSDPMLVNPPTDFGLLPGSPAIGAASDGSNLGARDSAVAAPTMVVRIAGSNRYETASELHRFAWPTDGEGSPVYVATGENYADALAAGAIAGHEGGSLLLVQRDVIPAATWAELERIAPSTITIVGGPAAVSTDVEARLLEIANHVDRVPGANRYATAAALSEATYAPGTERVYVATGESFPDALAAVPSAALSGAPILLTTRNAVPSETEQELVRLAPNEVVVLGGPGAVSDAVVGQLEGLATTVTRLFGPDRYSTASAIGTAALDEGLHPGTWAYITSGANFPDALAAGPVASMQDAHFQNGPILLTLRDTIPPATIAALRLIRPDHIIVIGGTAVVSTVVEEQLRRTDW